MYTVGDFLLRYLATKFEPFGDMGASYFFVLSLVAELGASASSGSEATLPPLYSAALRRSLL